MTMLANESASRVGPETGQAQGIDVVSPGDRALLWTALHAGTYILLLAKGSMYSRKLIGEEIGYEARSDRLFFCWLTTAPTR